MHDFVAVITWTPADPATIDSQGLSIFIKNAQGGWDSVATTSLQKTASTFSFNVLKDRTYQVKIVSQKMAKVSAPLVIEFTTPPSLVPPPTAGGVTYEPLP